MGKGKDLFGHFNDLAKQKGPGSEESHYAGILFQALLMVGERRTFELLEEADEKGKRAKTGISRRNQKETRTSKRNRFGVIRNGSDHLPVVYGDKQMVNC
jgi:hypothetical protein